jgi:hypothetical protein
MHTEVFSTKRKTWIGFVGVGKGSNVAVLEFEKCKELHVEAVLCKPMPGLPTP